MNFSLHSSPLQGFTDFRFRNAFNKYFGGIDSFYTPYIRLHGKFKIKPANEQDILPKNNQGISIIPQIMTKDSDEFLFVAKYVKNLGYKELNWNLGCPYPMVTKRGMGSGLINNPKKIDTILNRVFSESDIKVSIKMRLGYESSDEIFQVFPILEKYPIRNIAIHPRIGKQLYKGEVDLDSFRKCLDTTNHKVCYNGDITSVEVFNSLREKFPEIDHWLIGRGIITNPFLSQMIKNNTLEYPENRIEIFAEFHDTLFHEYEKILSGSNHLIMKMLQFWEYFILSFPNSSKGLKKIKKAKNIHTYENTVKEILNS